jgi:hypothetical protein
MAQVKKGKKMTLGKGWTLTATKGVKREFKGTLVGTFNFGNTRLAVFTVPK